MKIAVLFLAFSFLSSAAWAVEAPIGYDSEAGALPAPEPRPAVVEAASPPVFADSAGPVEVSPARSARPAAAPAQASAPTLGTALMSFESDRPQDRKFPAGVFVSMERVVTPPPVSFPLGQYDVEEEPLPARRVPPTD